MNINLKVKGIYTLSVFKKSTNGDLILKNEHSFNNLVTTAGLSQISANNNPPSFIRVGSSNKIAEMSDTELGAQIAVTGTVVAQSTAAGVNEAEGYVYWIRTFEFAQGRAAGNISEVGAGGAASALYSRALVVDANGNPLTIVVQSDEILHVTYEMRTYIPRGDNTGTLQLSGGVDGAVRTWTSRAAYRDKRSSGETGGWGIAAVFQGLYGFSTPYEITSEDDGPSRVGASRLTTQALTQGQQPGVAAFNLMLGLTQQSVTVKSIFVGSQSFCWQIGFDKEIIKAADEQLSLNFSFSYTNAA